MPNPSSAAAQASITFSIRMARLDNSEYYSPHFPLPPPHNPQSPPSPHYSPSPPKVAPPHNAPSPPKVSPPHNNPSPPIVPPRSNTPSPPNVPSPNNPSSPKVPPSSSYTPPHHPITPSPPPFPVPATPPSFSIPPPSPIVRPPPHPISPPSPPHIVPPPPSTPGHHSTFIIVIFVSLGGLFFLAFLSVALCCFIQKKKKETIQKAENIKIDEHVQVQEAVVPGPHGEQAILFIEEDVHIQEDIKKTDIVNGGSHIKPSQHHPQCIDVAAVSSSSSHHHHSDHNG